MAFCLFLFELMTSIVFHNGILLADSLNIVRIGGENVVRYHDKLFISDERDFAYAVAGVRSSNASLEEFLKKEIRKTISYCVLNKEDPVEKLTRLFKMTNDASVIFVTLKEAYFLQPDMNLYQEIKSEGCFMGTGGDLYHAYTLMEEVNTEEDTIKYYNEVVKYDTLSGGQIKSIKQKELKKFKIDYAATNI